MSGDEKAERFDGSWITANTFDILGVRPMLGRNFRAGEDTPQGEKVAILVVLHVARALQRRREHHRQAHSRERRAVHRSSA